MNDKSLTLSLTIEETNIILEGLGHVPFARAYEVVNKIQTSAKEQIEQRPPSVHVLDEDESTDQLEQPKAAAGT